MNAKTSKTRIFIAILCHILLLLLFCSFGSVFFSAHYNPVPSYHHRHHIDFYGHRRLQINCFVHSIVCCALTLLQLLLLRVLFVYEGAIRYVACRRRMYTDTQFNRLFLVAVRIANRLCFLVVSSNKQRALQQQKEEEMLICCVADTDQTII